MEPLYPNNIWAFASGEEESSDDFAIEFKIKWVMPKDHSKLFWEITTKDDPSFKKYASKLVFDVPSTADYNRLYCKGELVIDDDNVAHFISTEGFNPYPI